MHPLAFLRQVLLESVDLFIQACVRAGVWQLRLQLKPLALRPARIRRSSAARLPLIFSKVFSPMPGISSSCFCESCPRAASTVVIPAAIELLDDRFAQFASLVQSPSIGPPAIASHLVLDLPGASLPRDLMSIFQPSSLAARRTFCPFLPIASDNCVSSTITSSCFVAQIGDCSPGETFAGCRAFSAKVVISSLKTR